MWPSSACRCANCEGTQGRPLSVWCVSVLRLWPQASDPKETTCLDRLCRLGDRALRFDLPPVFLRSATRTVFPKITFETNHQPKEETVRVQLEVGGACPVLVFDVNATRGLCAVFCAVWLRFVAVWKQKQQTNACGLLFCHPVCYTATSKLRKGLRINSFCCDFPFVALWVVILLQFVVFFLFFAASFVSDVVLVSC